MSRRSRRRLKQSPARRTERWPLPWFVVGAVVLVGVVVVVSRLASPQPAATPGVTGLSGVVIDQLSPDASNETLRASLRSDMTSFGLNVTEFEGDDVVVETYRSLGDLAPSVVVIRSHSGILTLESGEEEYITALFTNEPYNRAKYVTEQLQDRVLIVRRDERDEHLRFGVSPWFILKSMEENLPRTVVIIAGCSCLGRTDLAESFRARGASVVLSWNEPVSLEYLDQATEHLVNALLVERMTVENATVSTMAKFGSDPEFGAILLYYPPAAGRYTVAELAQ